MNITKKNQPVWQTLYQAAETFRDYKPWEHVDDSFLYGIQDPVSGEIGWCAIMGDAEEVFGLAIYVGDEGFEYYEDMIQLYDLQFDDLTVVFNMQSLNVDFVSKKETDKVDRKIYKQLGLKFKGRNQYINIRRHDPGYIPWYIDETQAVFVTHCLKQSIQVVEKVLAGEVRVTEYDDEKLLVMVSERKEDQLVWEAMYLDCPDPEVKENVPDSFIINRIKKELKKKDSVLFLSFQYLMAPVQEVEGERPYIPRLALWVDGDSGMIIDNKLFFPDDFWKNFQNNLLETFIKLEHIPLTIGVDSSMAMEMLNLYCDKLGIDLVYAPDHPLFEELQESMGDFF